MNPSVVKTNAQLVATLATLLCMPALARAATVIDTVPYTITASGTYELKSNLTANNTVGITVQAANVVINLNGFTLAQSQPTSAKDGIDVSADNVTVRNGTISGFQSAVSLRGSVGKAEDLRLLGNVGIAILIESGSDNAVVNCVIIGLTDGKPGTFGIVVRSSSGDLLKGNQISEFAGGIDCTADVGSGCAILHNYVANAFKGIDLSASDYYQGNVVTGCTNAFQGGNAIGTENGGE
jgi:hypothetical protein